jgi:hypothetical protein
LRFIAIAFAISSNTACMYGTGGSWMTSGGWGQGGVSVSMLNWDDV